MKRTCRCVARLSLSFNFLLGTAQAESLSDVRSASPLAWIKQSFSDLQPADPSSPLAERLQFWADHLDQMLRKQPGNSELMREIPRPRVRLILNDGLNAFTSSETVCYRIPVLKGQGGEADPKTLRLVSVSNQGKVGIYSREEVACLDLMQAQRSAQETADFYEKNLAAGSCNISVASDTLILGEGCKAAMDDFRADGIVVNALSPWITIETGLVRLFERESLLVYTLLHELAHFYRAHGSLNKKAYEYFYRLNASTHRDHKPAVDAQLESLGAKVQALPAYSVQAVEGQRWHSEMFSYSRYALNLLIKPTCSAETSLCFVACRPFQLLMDTQMASLGRFPQTVLDNAGEQIYFEWENNFSQCLAAIDVDGNEAKPSTAVVSWEAAQKVFWWGERSSKLIDIAQSMNQKYLEKEAAKNQLLQAALDANLGYYTSEEEADRLALRWLAWLGISVETSYEHWLTYAKAVDAFRQHSDFDFSFKKCIGLFEADPRWTDAGQVVPIPIGTFAEPHHSSCFRAWLMEREVSANEWPLGPSLWAEAEKVGGPYLEMRQNLLSTRLRIRMPPRPRPF